MVAAAIAMMISEPSAEPTPGDIRSESARPEAIAPAVPAIVTVAITRFGAAAIRLPRMPDATRRKVFKVETAAMSTAEGQTTVLLREVPRGTPRRPGRHRERQSGGDTAQGHYCRGRVSRAG